MPFVSMSRLNASERPKMNLPERVNILGVGVSVLNLDIARETIVNALAEKQKGYICVTEVHGVIEAQLNPKIRNIFNRSFLSTPDGMPLVWLGKMAGNKQMGRVYGPDLMAEMMNFTSKSGHTHFLYGGVEGVAQDLKLKLESRYPGIRIVGTYTPPFRPLNPEEEKQLIEQVAGARPDFFWIGISTPKQELFMAHYLDKLDTTIMVGVGAAFDFFTGRVRQAPRWIQRSGFEWLFRVLSEPRRLWRRYFVCISLFLWNIFLQKTGLKKFPLEISK